MQIELAASLSEPRRRCIAWFVTAVVHGWMLYLLLHHRPFIVMHAPVERWSVLWILPEAQPSPVPQLTSSATARHEKKPATHPSAPRSDSVAAPAAITIQPQPESESAAPRVDWDVAATRSAKELAQKLDAPPEQRALDGSDRKQPAEPKKKSEFE